LRELPSRGPIGCAEIDLAERQLATVLWPQLGADVAVVLGIADMQSPFMPIRSSLSTGSTQDSCVLQQTLLNLLNIIIF